MDSRSSLIPICLILTSGASLRSSLESVGGKLGPLDRDVLRDSLYLSLTCPFPRLTIDNDDIVADIGVCYSTMRARKRASEYTR